MSRLIQSVGAYKTNIIKGSAVICYKEKAEDSLPPRRNKRKFHCWCCIVLEVNSVSVLSPQAVLRLLRHTGLHHIKLDADHAVQLQVAPASRWVEIYMTKIFWLVKDYWRAAVFWPCKGSINISSLIVSFLLSFGNVFFFLIWCLSKNTQIFLWDEKTL
jgi:hypothetical protein